MGFSAVEPLEPKTGTARTVPPPNRNRTLQKRGLPANAGATFDEVSDLWYCTGNLSGS